MFVINVEVPNPTTHAFNNCYSLVAVMHPFSGSSSSNDIPLPEPSEMISPHRLVPINPSHSGQFMGVAVTTTVTSTVPVVYRDPTRVVRPREESGFHPLPATHPRFIYFNVGPAPGPCMICQYSPNGEPRSIFLQHCIPQCPAIVTSRNIVFATSDYIRRNDVRPCVIYLPGTTLPSVVQEDIDEIPPIYIGLFTLPEPQHAHRPRSRVPRPRFAYHGHVGTYTLNSNLPNPFSNVYSNFIDHAPPPYLSGFQTPRRRFD